MADEETRQRICKALKSGNAGPLLNHIFDAVEGSAQLEPVEFSLYDKVIQKSIVKIEPETYFHSFIISARNWLCRKLTPRVT